MNAIKIRLKEKYGLSNYQIAQLTFLFKTLSSEISKMILMGILFHRQLGAYLFILLIMVFLRTITGGLHFYTYAGCLVTSIIFIGSALLLYINVNIPLYMEMVLVLVSILTCYLCGPITSKYRPPYPQESMKNRSRLCVAFIFIYSILLYIFPGNGLLQAGFWVIPLHSVQLLLAKAITRGGEQ